MYLFFDTETTGLPKNWHAPLTDLHNWPRLVQLAWITFDEDGNQTGGADYIIRPEGFIIPPEVTRIHRISHQMAVEHGHPLSTVLHTFCQVVTQSEILVAHNLSFDEKIIGAELLRTSNPDFLSTKTKICTMHGSTDYCKLPGPYGFKYPKLSELHQKLFNTGIQDAHNAAVDIQATARCFWELRRLNVI